jgi:hypothetical protein
MSKKTLRFYRPAFPVLTSFFALFIISSCRPTKEAARLKLLDNKGTPFLIEQLKKNEFTYEWLTAKFSAEAIIDDKSTSFNVSMRAKKDSVLWFSISPALGIEVARVIVTKDSVKMIDRLNSKFFIGDFKFISRMLHTEVDFEILQSLLVGNSVEFYEEDDLLKSSINDNKYLLSTVRKRKLRKVIQKDKELKEPMQSIWLEPETYKVSRLLFKEFETDKSFDATYSDFQQVNGQLLPAKLTFDIIAEKKMKISIDFTKTQLESHQNVPFSIPEKYTRMY